MMTILRTETTMIPNTFKGKELADEFEQKLREQCAFTRRTEDTRYIIIDATYHFSIMRLIDADRVLRLVDNGNLISNSNYQKVRKLIENIPSVELVRCRDCKYAEENWNGKDIYCLRTSSFPWSNDSFCSDGERKDGDSE